MAKNLRAKIPAEDTLFIHDVNTAATKQFLDEHPQGVRVAQNVREVAEKAVRMNRVLSTIHNSMMN
jgi:3-hydroxyisobutyrate dehydrogenase